MGSDSLSIYYSNIDTIETNNHIVGLWTGENNIFEDPLFTDEFCHLNNCESPCVNAGTDALEVNGNWYYCPTTDIENEARPYVNTLPDIGIDETPCLETSIKNYQEAIFSNILNNYPNPFSNQTTIEFTLPKSEFVTLSIYDITGKQLKTILSKKLSKGNHKINWNAEGMNEGIYFIKMETKNSSIVHKAIIME